MSERRKKMGLTWEDAQDIYLCTIRVADAFDKDITLFNSTEEMYNEVLRLFMEKEDKK